MRTRPVIVHLDLDAFFSAVEQLHKPSLRGKPVVVGGIGRRGVVSTASYEARRFGVGSAMPIGEARRRCPNAAYLAPRFGAYRAASQVVIGLLRELSPLVEQVSVDEAFVDLTPTHPQVDVPGVTVLASDFRARVRDVTGLTVSVGVGTSKLIAKIASDLGKPDGLTVVAPGEEAATLAPMPVRRLPGVGPATADRLHRYGIHLIGELAATPQAELVAILGQAHGAGLHHYAQGVDNRSLVPEREAKSVSAETTFETDLTDKRQLGDLARRLAARVGERLRDDGSSGRTVTLKLRRHDFTTLTRSSTLDQPTDSTATITGNALQLLAAVDVSEGVRLIGVGVSGLSDFTQADLLAALDGPAVGEPDVPDLPEASPPSARVWRPGQDVRHAEYGPGWVQGTGIGRVTVRFEGPHTPPGPIRTFVVGDPALEPAEAPVWDERADRPGSASSPD